MARGKGKAGMQAKKLAAATTCWPTLSSSLYSLRAPLLLSWWDEMIRQTFMRSQHGHATGMGTGLDSVEIEDTAHPQGVLNSERRIGA